MLNFRQCGASSSNHHLGHYLLHFSQHRTCKCKRMWKSFLGIGESARSMERAPNRALVASILNIFASKLRENESMFDEQIFEVGWNHQAMIPYPVWLIPKIGFNFELSWVELSWRGLRDVNPLKVKIWFPGSWNGCLLGQWPTFSTFGDYIFSREKKVRTFISGSIG